MGARGRRRPASRSMLRVARRSVSGRVRQSGGLAAAVLQEYYRPLTHTYTVHSGRRGGRGRDLGHHTRTSTAARPHGIVGNRRGLKQQERVNNTFLFSRLAQIYIYIYQACSHPSPYRHGRDLRVFVCTRTRLETTLETRGLRSLLKPGCLTSRPPHSIFCPYSASRAHMSSVAQVCASEASMRALACAMKNCFS